MLLYLIGPVDPLNVHFVANSDLVMRLLNKTAWENSFVTNV